jgi:hypothetical protein
VKQLANWHLVHIIFGCESGEKESTRFGIYTSDGADQTNLLERESDLKSISLHHVCSPYIRGYLSRFVAATDYRTL